MIGFDAIGQGAIGELFSDVADTIVFVPGTTVAVAGAAPFVTAGSSVAPSAKAVTVTLVAPAIRAGAFIDPTAADVTATVVPGSVQISATVTVASAAIAASKVDPFVAGGKSVAVPAAAVAATKGATPFVTGGKSVAPTASLVSVTPNVPGISISASERPPAALVSVTPNPPQIVGGNYVDARNTILMVTPYGEIGSSSIGQFSIGEGEVSSRIVLMPPLVTIGLVAPRVAAGKSVRPPSASVAVSSSRAEIDSRCRKLRVFAIAS